MAGHDFLGNLLLTREIKLGQEGFKNGFGGLVEANLGIVTAASQYPGLAHKQYLHAGMTVLSEYCHQVEIAAGAFNILGGLNVLQLADLVTNVGRLFILELSRR